MAKKPQQNAVLWVLVFVSRSHIWWSSKQTQFEFRLFLLFVEVVKHVDRWDIIMVSQFRTSLWFLKKGHLLFLGLQLATLKKKAGIISNPEWTYLFLPSWYCYVLLLGNSHEYLGKKTFTKPYDQSILGQNGQQNPRPWEAGGPPPPMPGLPPRNSRPKPIIVT